jgi:prenyltransferase beta subunit
MDFYQMLQCPDGHWSGDYGGPMFLMPGLIIALYITKTTLEDYKREGMIAYLLNHQQEDGGWGTHIECASTMFGTILNYSALRLLGVSYD